MSKKVKNTFNIIMKEIFQKYKKHLLALLTFALITYAYMPSVLSGKVLQQGDVIKSKGTVSETDAYHAKEGKTPLWTNSIFGGMPTYQISMKGHDNPVKKLMKPSIHHPANKLFISLVCAYLMFLAFGVKPWLSIIGAFAFTYTTGNLIIIEAGHNTKMQAVAYAPLVIAGLKFLLNKRWLLGANLLGVGIALELVSNHIQISFYLAIMVTLWMIAEFIIHLKNKQLPVFFKVIGISLLLAVIGIAINSQSILLTKEYSEATIRGKSDLTISNTANVLETKKEKSDGLDYDYAFQWSNGWQDIMTLVIPNYAGSGGAVDLGKNSVFDGVLPKQAIEQFPFAYWGELPFTAGPIYFGASMFLLFILAIVFTKGPLKWWILAAFILSIMMSTGKNHFAWFNSFLFHHFPLYNKFRVPSIALTLAQWSLPLLSIVGLSNFIEAHDNTSRLKSLKTAGIAVGCLLVLLTFFSSAFTDFKHQAIDPSSGEVLRDFDQGVFDQYKIQTDLLEEARADLIRKDGIRSILFAGLMFLLLWFFVKGKINNKYAIIGICAIILIDLWGVDKRYLSDDDFKRKRVAEQTPAPSQADVAIMQDKSYYRVLDIRNPSIMSNSNTALFHRSIGGYHPAKIRRYQELYDWHTSKDIRANNFENSSILNMLNTKYIIGQNKDGGDSYRENSNNLGAAWFVENVRTVENADSAILALGSFEPKTTAIIEQNQSSLSSTVYTKDSASSIQLQEYHPVRMVYKSNNSNDGFAVFSEIFYKAGWKATIDNNPVEIEQTNFVLRGIPIPKGEHEIVFSFEPKTYAYGRTIMLTGNALLYLLLAGSILYWIKENFTKKAALK